MVYGFKKPVPEPITFSEINAYSSVMAWPMGHWEVQVIRRLDGLVRADEFHPIEFEPPGTIKALMHGMKARGKVDPGENVG